MSALLKIGSGSQSVPAGALLLRFVVLVLPTALLLGSAARHPETGNALLWTATGFQGLVCVLSLLSRRTWRQPVGPTVITLYLVARFFFRRGRVMNGTFHAGDTEVVNEPAPGGVAVAIDEDQPPPRPEDPVHLGHRAGLVGVVVEAVGAGDDVEGV